MSQVKNQVQEENGVTIRIAAESDLQNIIILENKMWVNEQRCTKENFLKRLREPLGFFLIAEDINLKIVGTFFCIRKSYTPKSSKFTWQAEGIDGGRSPDADGNALFGVSVTVDQDAPKGTLRSLFNEWRQLAKDGGLSYIYGGARIPGLIAYGGDPEEYVRSVVSGSIFDPVLSKYIRCDLKTGNLISNYFEDPESLNFGVEVYDSI